MTWRDQLRPASFRGVEFHVLSSGATFGRRSVLHEYPFRDLPYVEDLGRRARSVRVEAIVIGDDYIARRDALIAAVEEAGPGKLVHPYFGELTVSLDESGAQIDEATANGGMARITFSCIESGEAKFPAASSATQDVVDQRAIAVGEASADGLGRVLDMAGLPAFAFDSALATVSDALTAIEDLVAVIPGVGTGRTNVMGLVGLLRPELADLLREPVDLARRVQAVFGAVRSALAPEEATRTLAKVATFGNDADPIPQTTATRRREAINRISLVEMVRCAAVVERARAVAGSEFTDYDSAVAIRESVTEQIDAVADITSDDALYQALSALRAVVVRDIGQRGADLARLVTVTPIDTVPALVLAYDLYEDASRDADIIARNAIQHPGFLSAGLALEVLGDA